MKKEISMRKLRISEEAYNGLLRMKRDNESLSEVILRVYSEKIGTRKA